MSAPGSVRVIQRRYAAGERIVMVTAYDHPTARLAHEAGVDVILVGDSLGNVVLGLDSTLPVTLEDMIRHTAAVVRGAATTPVVADMPFMSYQPSVERAVLSAGRLLAETGAQAVKLEGGVAIAPTIARLTELGIPVVGHVGYTPQSVLTLGQGRVQGRDESGARRLMADARAVAEAGALAMVLELVPSDLAAAVTAEVGVATIGIGAGPGCSGQVLVLHDLLGMGGGRTLRFVKQYASVGEVIREAVARYAADVREGRFPGPEHSFPGTLPD